jgi:CRISPR-associated endoribonuclease Cas6
VTFDLVACRFSFIALESISFPAGKAGNIVRGAFGSIFRRIACDPGCSGAATCDRRASCAYARVFEPSVRGSGPSGLADPPRPFVFRPGHIDGRTIRAGESFYFDLHLFDAADSSLGYFIQTFSKLVHEGLGSRRGRAELGSIFYLDEARAPQRAVTYDPDTFRLDGDPPQISIPLRPCSEIVKRMRVQFLTPTELKGEGRGAVDVDFGLLFARSRDRLSTLRALYGAAPLPVDFVRMGELARQVRLIRSALTRVNVDRRSSRTGQIHSIGGFVGEAEYSGELSAFIPFLRAAEWTGVGRQTVWGKGEIRCIILPCE